MMSLEEFQHWFNQRFFILLEEKGNDFISQGNNSSVQKIISHLYIFAENGRRFRPYLSYVGYVTEGGDHDIFPLLAAMELLHFFCLVHEDIMSNAIVRDEASTINNQFDISTAILIGDLLLAWAFECLHAVEEIEPYTIDDVIKEFGKLLSEIIHGQILDVLLVENSDDYSFSKPLVIGMLLAGADDDMLQFAHDYATPLGMAFQLHDHLNAEGLIEDYIAKAEDVLFDHDKNGEEIWQDLIEEIRK